MHNGGIAGFKCIKRELLKHLSNKTFKAISGHTDSEMLFLIWMTFLEKEGKVNNLPIQQLKLALIRTLKSTINLIIELP
eukprot:UN07286